ncbi:MAG: hypothetical protein CNF01_02320 [Halieaceae bacterium MED-G27]|nr:MAG: hypothetical protein CNF01_02320 [Halieaceae bacterium MED-G27]|tara:strand:+ start:21038 stop:21409 length:372 start_codon:yes stop_codon:yes gene_type:complete
MTPRGHLTGPLWIALWCLSAGYLSLRGGEVFAAGGGWALWLLSMAPLLLFLVGVARDSLQWIIWFCLLLLFYFVVAVEAVFARPNNLLVVGALADLILLFSVCTAYIRYRGRELRASADDSDD